MWSSVVRWWRQNHWWCLWLQTQYIYVPPHDCERLFFPIHPKVPLIQDPAHFLLVTSPVTNIAASFLLLDDVSWIFLGFGVLNCDAIFQINHPLYQPLFAFLLLRFFHPSLLLLICRLVPTKRFFQPLALRSPNSSDWPCITHKAVGHQACARLIPQIVAGAPFLWSPALLFPFIAASFSGSQSL